LSSSATINIGLLGNAIITISAVKLGTDLRFCGSTAFALIDSVQVGCFSSSAIGSICGSDMCTRRLEPRIFYGAGFASEFVCTFVKASFVGALIVLLKVSTFRILILDVWEAQEEIEVLTLVMKSLSRKSC